MTAKSKQILITSESREIVIVRWNSGIESRDACPLCGEIMIREQRRRDPDLDLQKRNEISGDREPKTQSSGD